MNTLNSTVVIKIRNPLSSFKNEKGVYVQIGDTIYSVSKLVCNNTDNKWTFQKRIKTIFNIPVYLDCNANTMKRIISNNNLCLTCQVLSAVKIVPESDRTFVVRQNSSYSNYFNILVGVPQRILPPSFITYSLMTFLKHHLLNSAPTLTT